MFKLSFDKFTPKKHYLYSCSNKCGQTLGFTEVVCRLLENNSLSYSAFLLIWVLLFEAGASKLTVNTVCKQEEAAHRCLFTLLVLFFLCTKVYHLWLSGWEQQLTFQRYWSLQIKAGRFPLLSVYTHRLTFRWHHSFCCPVSLTFLLLHRCRR